MNLAELLVSIVAAGPGRAFPWNLER